MSQDEADPDLRNLVFKFAGLRTGSSGPAIQAGGRGKQIKLRMQTFTSVADTYPGSGALLTPGSGMGKK